MDAALLESFGLNPDILHLNHGAFGVAPVAVRRVAAAWRDRAERNPHRFNRVELPPLIAAARECAAGFLGIDPSRTAWVRNVSEGVSAVLGSLELRPRDELVISTHGYGAVGMALRHHAARAGAEVVEAAYPVDAADAAIVSAYAAACSSRTRLVVIDRITSPTATVIPAAAVAVAVAGPGRSVLIDAAHAPGQLDDDIAAFGADHWIGNLHKWAYTPRGSAILWSRPGTEVTPTVLSWQLQDGYAASFDYPGTWDYAGWLAAPDGLAQWEALGGWQTVAQLAGLVSDGQKRVADALGVPLERLPAVPAPAMRLIPLPDGVLSGKERDTPINPPLACDSRRPEDSARHRRDASRDPVPGAERRLPLVQGGGQGQLPAGLANPWRGRPAQREVPARLEPAADPAGGHIPVEPVERVADDGQLEVARSGVKSLGAGHNRPDIPCTGGGRLDPDHFHPVSREPHLVIHQAQPLQATAVNGRGSTKVMARSASSRARSRARHPRPSPPGPASAEAVTGVRHLCIIVLIH